MRRALTAGLTVAAVSAALVQASAQELPGGFDDRTRVYVVVVDGLNVEELPLMPFLSSLAEDGAYYPEARSVMIAETTPNHVAMVTGTYPDKNGIVANNYPDVTTGEVASNGQAELLESDSIFTLVARQCPQLTTAAVTSKDYLYRVMDHDRSGDGQVDVDSNFANVDDPAFIPGVGITPDERTIVEALRVSRELDPDFLFLNLGSVDRVGHLDQVGGLTTVLPTGSRPAVRDVQRTLTDTYLRGLVEQLRLDGRWESTRLLVTADHSMDWSLPTSTVSLFPQLQADPLLADQVIVAQNGGAALYSLRDRDAPEAPQRLKRLREIAVATDGVDQALYRQPNPVDGGDEHWVGRVQPDWHQTHPRSGDLVVTVQDGLRVTEPSSTSNPIPGNHGMTSTTRIPMVVAGGAGVVQRTVEGGSDDPDVRAPDQAENVDVAPTAAWLLGIEPPAAGFDGRVLAEAFTERPDPTCVRAAVGADPAPAPAPDSGSAPDDGGDEGAAPGPAASGERLPATGLAVALPVLALLALVAGLLARRRAPAEG